MNYVSVTAPDINNGLGCRVTLWVAGCNHNCPGCHNKWTHDYNIGENLENAWDEIAKWLSKDTIEITMDINSVLLGKETDKDIVFVLTDGEILPEYRGRHRNLPRRIANIIQQR